MGPLNTSFELTIIKKSGNLELFRFKYIVGLERTGLGGSQEIRQMRVKQAKFRKKPILKKEENPVSPF